MNDFGICSSSGREQIKFTSIEQINDSENGCLIYADLKIINYFWDKSILNGSSNLVEESVFYVFNIVLNVDALKEILGDMKLWLEGKHSRFKKELSADKYQSLMIEIGVHEQLICSEFKPAFTIIYKFGTKSYKNSFLVDQSCINCFVNEIELSLT